MQLLKTVHALATLVLLLGSRPVVDSRLLHSPSGGSKVGILPQHQLAVPNPSKDSSSSSRAHSFEKKQLSAEAYRVLLSYIQHTVHPSRAALDNSSNTTTGRRALWVGQRQVQVVQAAFGRGGSAVLPGDNRSNLIARRALQQTRQALAAATDSNGDSIHNITPQWQTTIGSVCSATVNYGASVGDASQPSLDGVPIFVASFDVAVTQGMDKDSSKLEARHDQAWLLGWHFAAGEHIQQDGDLFGDGAYEVHLMNQTGGQGQIVAVLGNGSIGASNNEVSFNFVGQKGPKGLYPDLAPFRIAPPSRILLNNHHCWPLLTQEQSDSSGITTGAANPFDSSRGAMSGTTGVDGNVTWPVNTELAQLVATPQLQPDKMPRQLLVEYLPVEFADEVPGLFANKSTQLYFRLSSLNAEPVDLQDITIQYWFHGPEDGSKKTESSSSAGDSSSSSPANASSQAALEAAQFFVTCSDATPALGCSSLLWNVTVGLPNVFGARFVLNMWFDPKAPSSNHPNVPYYLVKENTTDQAVPGRSTSSATDGTSSSQHNTTVGVPAKQLSVVEAVVVLNYRRFFTSINARSDYSFLDTPLAPNSSTSSSQDNSTSEVQPGQSGNDASQSDTARPIRRFREPNPRMPAYIMNRLAWGSPPKAMSVIPDGVTAVGPGSYCLRSANNSLICGVDMQYCCFGNGPLDPTAPQDWQQRLLADEEPATGTNITTSGKSDNKSSSVHSNDVRNSSGQAGAMAESTDGHNSVSTGLPPYAVVLAVVLPTAVLCLASVIFLLRRRAKAKSANINLASQGWKRSTTELWWHMCCHATAVVDGGGRMWPSSRAGNHTALISSVDTALCSSSSSLSLQQGVVQRNHDASCHNTTTGQLIGSSSVLSQQELRHVMSTDPHQALPMTAIRRARTLPSCAFSIARACSSQLQQHQSQMHAAGRCSTGNSTVHHSTNSGNAAQNRPVTWDGRLSPVDFPQDLINQQLAYLHSSATQLSPMNSAGKSLCDTGTAGPTAGAAAAAVEAAIVAINAALTASSTRLQAPVPSLYKALMSTGFILKPPGGLPIPLNVDYASEIQPNLGRLLGIGGFGHVYEGSWRGHRVAVKLLAVTTQDPSVVDAFLREVALCACLRGCSRVVKLLGACLGGLGVEDAVQNASALQTNSPGSSMGGLLLSSAEVASPPQQPHINSTSATNSDESGVSMAASNIMSPFCNHQLSDIDSEASLAIASQPQQRPQHQQMALIMELMEGGSLAKRIYNPNKRRLTYPEILQIALDITAGLAYLHPAVIHRDLKPQNVLLDRHGRAALADFGISRFKNPQLSYLSVTQHGGTPQYMAPEVVNGNRITEAADVYSFGCILYECVARKSPFSHLLSSDAKDFNVLFKIILAVAINKERPPLPADTPDRLASLVKRCWLEDPTQRPHVSQLTSELQDMLKVEMQRCHEAPKCPGSTMQ